MGKMTFEGRRELQSEGMYKKAMLSVRARGSGPGVAHGPWRELIFAGDPHGGARREVGIAGTRDAATARGRTGRKSAERGELNRR